MSTALGHVALRHPAAWTRRRSRADCPLVGYRTIMLSCGIAYTVVYVVTNDVIAATRYDGYRRMDQAVSELSAKGAPTRPFLVAMLPLYTVLMIAFGVGVSRVAGSNRALRVTGAVAVSSGVVGILWLPFPMSSRQDLAAGAGGGNDVGHLVLTALTIASLVALLGSGSAAFGSRFRRYSYASIAAVLVFGGLTGMLSTGLQDGKATPFMGLYERVSIGAWLLWISVLAVMLLRREAAHPRRLCLTPAHGRPN